MKIPSITTTRAANHMSRLSSFIGRGSLQISVGLDHGEVDYDTTDHYSADNERHDSTERHFRVFCGYGVTHHHNQTDYGKEGQQHGFRAFNNAEKKHNRDCCQYCRMGENLMQSQSLDSFHQVFGLKWSQDLYRLFQKWLFFHHDSVCTPSFFPNTKAKRFVRQDK